MLQGQVQAVTAGSGVRISTQGVLSINASDVTFNGFVKTNNNGAYNAYVWPNGPLPVKGQLTTDASGNLSWGDTDFIPWTALGQLVVGTGPGTDTILNVGTDTSFLVADSSTTSGLNWSSAETSAALLPAGTTADQPVTPVLGQIRYNTDVNVFEGYQGPTTFNPGGADWLTLSSQPTGPSNVESIFYYNTQTLSTSYTLSENANALSAGPILIATGVTVTVPAGSNWAII